MKIYKTQVAVEKDIKDGVLSIEGDVKFECSISIDASIIVTTGNITAGNINAGNITASDITAWNINASDINARDINAGNINAGNINARDINARDILYYAFCSVYNSIKCTSIKAKRDKHSEPICLDGELTIKPKEDDEVARAINLLTEKGKIVDGKILI